MPSTGQGPVTLRPFPGVITSCFSFQGLSFSSLFLVCP